MGKTSKQNWPSASIAFLKRLWKHHHQTHYVFLGTLHRQGGRWREHAINLADHCDFEAFFARYPRAIYDLYFCPNRFRQPARQKRHAFPTPFAWSDIDRGDTDRCSPSPNLIFETSPDRFQALWLWDAPESSDRAELFSRTLTDTAKGDHNGWSITKYLRIPGTYNHKPEYDCPKVRWIKQDWTPQSSRPTVQQETKYRFLAVPLSEVSGTVDEPPNDFPSVFRKYGPALHPRVRQLIRDKRVRERDRSKCIYEIVVDLARANASVGEIHLVLQRNPYFIGKYGRSRYALNREVDRILNKLRGTQ